MKSSQLFSLLITLTFCLPVFSETIVMKPGLWEHSFTVKSQSGKTEKSIADLKAKMAKMSETQREMMQAAMAQQGIGLDQKANNVKVCISKEQADNLEIPQGQTKNCVNEIISRTANTVHIKFECKGSTKTTGEGEFKLTSPTAYTGKSVINTTTNGEPDRIDMNQKGKWLSAECGAIKNIPTKK